MATSDNTASDIETSQADSGRKGRPTPKRNESRNARAQYIASNQSKEQRKQDRQKMAQLREQSRVGMMNGDERYLPARDKGPQRKFVRDIVDARISIGEFLIPAMVIILLMTFLPAQWQVISLLAIWGYLAISVLDAVVLGFICQRRLEHKFGKDKVQPGFRWYAAMRAMQFRMLRMPKPQVKRFAQVN